jgi:hypothetical protein
VLAGADVTSVIAREGVILAGTRDGVYRSPGRGATWVEVSDGLHHRLVRWLAFHPDVSDLEVAGTEPAAIFVSRNGGDEWRECPEVGMLRDKYGWYLPYSPRAGCIRGFAFHGQRGYAAAEVGGVLRSDDGAETWAMVPGRQGTTVNHVEPVTVHPDVHSVYVHASTAENVLAATGGGLFSSDDGGERWRLLYRCYCRAAWWDPVNSSHIVLGPADGVDRSGRIEESWDGGATWQPAASGLSLPWERHMVERLIPVGDDLLAVLSNGKLLNAVRGQWNWQPTVPDAGHVNDVASMA